MLMLLFAILELIVLLAVALIRFIASATVGPAASGSASAVKTESTAAKKPEKQEPKELTDKQRYDIVSAILDDSLLILDRAYDALFNTGEAIFSAPEALHCTYFEYKEQYGGRKWRRAWESALADRFDCQCKLADKGNYHLFGKEM